MSGTNYSKYKTTAPILLFLIAMFLTTLTAVRTDAQSNELSLADILIALRSKKASMPEKNKILADAISTRGTTFALTPEIERELANSGADGALLESLKRRQEPVAKVAVPEKKTIIEQPVVTPPDAAFYEKRADAAVIAGDLDAALVEYGKAIAMDGNSISALMGRAAANAKKNAFILAIADYTRVIELDGRHVIALINRAEAHEKNNSIELAIADYKAAGELDPDNRVARENYARLKPAPAKPVVVEPKVAENTPPAPPVLTRPEYVDLGRIQESMYVRMSKPSYPEIAVRSRISGQVLVNIEIDEKGDVTSAKATTGHGLLRDASESAARRAKFKPATFDGTPIRSRGVIVYNFAPVN